MSMTLGQGMALAQVISVMATEMTAEQRHSAAERLRALPGDEITREFFADIAAGFDVERYQDKASPSEVNP